MSLYADLFYAGGFYGSDEYNNPPGGPANLCAYQNNAETVVLYWTLSPALATIHDFVWTVETDTDDSFTSPDLLSYTSTAPGVDFVAGKLHKGMAVPVYPRLQGEKRPMYWRVMGSYGGSDTVRASSVFMIPAAIDGVTRDAMIALMPDPIYKKTPDSNNYNMHWVYGDALDKHYMADVFAENDIGLDLVRDVSLQNKFGDMVRIRRPELMKAIDFREILKQFFIEARTSPTTRAVRNMVRSCLGVDPVITTIRDGIDMYIADDTPGQVVPGFHVVDGLVALPTPHVWNNVHLSSGVIVEVTNPVGAIVSRQFLQDILRKLVLANTPLYVTGIP